jgi:hypothetical protein
MKDEYSARTLVARFRHPGGDADPIEHMPQVQAFADEARRRKLAWSG